MSNSNKRMNNWISWIQARNPETIVSRKQREYWASFVSSFPPYWFLRYILLCCFPPFWLLLCMVFKYRNAAFNWKVFPEEAVSLCDFFLLGFSPTFKLFSLLEWKSTVLIFVYSDKPSTVNSEGEPPAKTSLVSNSGK